jgi:plastocyanin
MTRFSGIHPRTRALSITLAAIAALVAPAALGGAAVADTPPPPTTWTVQVGSETPNQAIQGMAFLPTDVYVNAGDTVNWVANSAEIHTVTFLATGQPLLPFNPFSPADLFRQGGTVYDGASYYNSGVMTNVSDSGFPAVSDYSLSFPSAGNFTYYCLVHGEMMKGTVHVQPAGTAYPYTQKDYDRESRAQAHAITLDGLALQRTAMSQSDRHTVLEGADDGVAMVMRFIQPTVVVRVGETVTFVNNGMGAPHTVTFGTEPANPFVPAGDPTAFAGGDLNSGILLPGSSFSVTFTSAGSFSYLCALHDYMGMVGKVIVHN